MNRQPGFLGKALRRQVIGIAPGRGIMDLDEALLDAAFEVGVDEAERDAEFRGNSALRTRTVRLHRTQQAENNALVLMLCVQQTIHPAPLSPPAVLTRS